MRAKRNTCQCPGLPWRTGPIKFVHQALTVWMALLASAVPFNFGQEIPHLQFEPDDYWRASRMATIWTIAESLSVSRVILDPAGTDQNSSVFRFSRLPLITVTSSPARSWMIK